MPEPTGLYSKYIVSKADGSPVDPKAQYFVLRIDTDKAARRGALEYSDAIERTMPELAADIRQWVALYMGSEERADA